MLPSAVWAAQPTAQHDVTARLRRCGVAMRLVRRGPEGAAVPRRASLIHSLALSVGASTRAFSFVRGDVRFVEGRKPSAGDRSWPEVSTSWTAGVCPSATFEPLRSGRSQSRKRTFKLGCERARLQQRSSSFRSRPG